MVSVILTCWKRFDNFEKIITAWLCEPKVNEVIIWDNSGTFKTDLSVTVINSNRNFGSSARYALGALIKNELALFCDDDIMPKAGFLDQLLPHFEPNRILGVTGRIFKGAYKDHVLVDAKKTDRVSRVDFLVGYLMLMHRNNLLGFNYSNSAKYCCELELYGKLKERDIKLYVVPTQNWESLPEGSDENALYLHPDAAEEKEKIFERYWKN